MLYLRFEERGPPVYSQPAGQRLLPLPGTREKTVLVLGSVVFFLDFFKRCLVRLRNIFAGNVGTYKFPLERAQGKRQRLRMKESAGDAAIIGTTAGLRLRPRGQAANQRPAVGSVEAIAYDGNYLYAQVNAFQELITT